MTSPSNQISNFIKSYPRTIIIGGDDNQSGILQGEILAETWKSNKEKPDNNKDDIMQYVMLKGPANDPATTARSKYSIQAINDSGIKTEELSSNFCNWDKTCARDAMEAVLLQHDGKIGVIIANNDEMAVGAIESLNKLGFNKSDSSKYIPVIGIGGLPETEELIKEGYMVGTVIQDPRDYANAVYAIGMNIVLGKPPLSGISYKLDETGNAIRLPYYNYTNS